MSEESLRREASQLKASLATIDARIDQARRELRGLRPNSDEQDIWETNLVILQAIHYFQKEQCTVSGLMQQARIFQDGRLKQTTAVDCW